MQPLIIKYLTQQLEAALKYHAIVLDDPENLHQFRIALRRMRSIIKLYMPEAYAFSEVLKQIFKQTNTVRELDVLLESLNKKHNSELYKYIRQYKDERYRTLLSPDVLDNQKRSLKGLQSEFIFFYTADPVTSLFDPVFTLYTKTLRTYKKTKQSASTAQLHQLRIDFKTSRYALELLHTEGIYYAAKEIKQCKKTLDKLGAIQDSQNQLDLLKNICQDHDTKACNKILKKRKKILRKLRKSSMN